MKRALENAQTANFKQRKKQKLAGARTIAVQSSNATGNATAGPSRLGPIINDKIKQLPGAIDVEKFAEARSFEISAMQSAMKAASSASTTRAWQVLPRHLRRRAASHNPRRVPLRLRDKARSEMDPMRRKVLGRSMPKLGKNKQLPRSVIFMKRQRDKKWLETHIWHAKRMKMENMWGYRLAVTPTEKAFRPSHRASIHGSILHDASYQCLVELKGPEATLKSILDLCCDAQQFSAGSQRASPGTRVFKTHIYEPNAYPHGLICPITIMWRALTPSKLSDVADAMKSKKGKGKGKEKEKEITSQLSSDQDLRTIWIRLHPAVVDKVLSALSASISQVLDTLRQKGSIVDVELANITGDVGIFEIMGPKSSQVLRGALSPVMAGMCDDFQRFWASLGDLQSSGSIPSGMIIGFTVNDPRLKFPPKNAKARLPNVLPSSPVFPNPTVASSSLWEQNTRNHLKKPRYQTKDLNERRSKNPIPGTPLQALRQDNRIPVMLIQTSIQAPGFNDLESIHGWTLIFPAGWSMPFFQQLTFTGTRVAGQRECKTQIFEAGAAHFPTDFPSVDAYKSHILAQAQKEKEKWARTPPAKRVNYQNLGTMSPWVPDWEVVLGLKEAWSDPALEGEQEGEGAGVSDLVTTQREPEPEPDLMQRDSAMNVDQPTVISPWLFRGRQVREIISSLSERFGGTQFFASLNQIRRNRGLEPFDSNTTKPEDLLKSALVSVRISICSKGAPSDLSLVYSIPDAELQKWRKDYSTAKAIGVAEPVEFVNLPDIIPPHTSIIGYITSGGYSLSRGEGFAIGAIALSRLLQLREQANRLSHYAKSKDVLFVKVRDRKGQHCRLAQVLVMEN